jgi:hypothetical protein
MAKNPTTWQGATPYDADASVAPSGLDSFQNPTPNGERPWRGATPYTHSGSVGKSGGKNLGNPYPKASDRVAAKPLAHGNGSMAPATAHSGPEPKTSPVRKWHKNRGYNMTVPSGDPDSVGPMRKPARGID